MIAQSPATRERRLWPAAAVLGSVGLGLLLAAVLVGLTVVGRHGGGPVQGFDNRVEAWGIDHRFGLVGAAKVVAFFGDAPKLGLLVAALTALLLLLTRSVKSLIPLVAFLGGELLVLLVREVIHRPRPPTADYPAPGAVPGVHETSFSFPSGHSVAVTAVLFASLGSLALVRRWVWPWVVALVVSLFVIDSRLVLGVHWFSDVLFGLLVGAAWGTAVALVFDPLTWDDLMVKRSARGRPTAEEVEGAHLASGSPASGPPDREADRPARVGPGYGAGKVGPPRR
ncbi:MAG TPA: phosphatase PAP2 family protein [Acidimicrobiales bacterium]|jgi:undecaprenyl-diphosphatase|nr:phosphatase PAP2 family protein [Acidimicrobiales bacterium]